MDWIGTFDAQALALHGLKVLAAGNEVDIRAPFAETGTEVPPQSTRAHERNPHVLPLLSVIGCSIHRKAHCLGGRTTRSDSVLSDVAQ
jgi:hypothetical protein